MPGVVMAKRAPDGFRHGSRSVYVAQRSTETTYGKLREIDEDSKLPEARRENGRNRHIARAAWERGECRVREPGRAPEGAVARCRASNAKLAKDVETTATILGVLMRQRIAGILASVITLLA